MLCLNQQSKWVIVVSYLGERDDRDFVFPEALNNENDNNTESLPSFYSEHLTCRDTRWHFIELLWLSLVHTWSLLEMTSYFRFFVFFSPKFEIEYIFKTKAQNVTMKSLTLSLQFMSFCKLFFKNHFFFFVLMYVSERHCCKGAFSHLCLRNCYL